MADANRTRIRELPNAPEAEQAVLGGLMLASDALAEVSGWLEPEDFYRRDHQLIFRGVKELHEKGRPFDAVTLVDWFDGAGLVHEVDNGAYLIQLATDTPSAANIVAWAEIVKEKAQQRKVIEYAKALMHMAFAPKDMTIDGLVAKAAADFTNLKGNPRAGGLRPYGELALEWFQDWIARCEAGGTLPGIALPWKEVTDALHGMQDAEAIVLAGRSNMGKSVLGFQIAHHTAGAGLHTLLFSMEMNGNQVVRRDIAAAGRVPHKWLQDPKGPLEEEHFYDRVTDALRQMKPQELLVDCSPQLSGPELIARARRAHMRKKVRLIVVDHLHEMKLPVKQGETIERGQLVRDLKGLAKELNCPIVILAQLNREGDKEGANKGRPDLRHLRGSGGIEEAADVVLLVHRPDKYDKDDAPGLVELIVAKGRDIETGTVINLRNRFDQMRAEDWGDAPPPIRKSERSGDYGGGRGFQPSSSRPRRPPLHGSKYQGGNADAA